MEEGGGAGRDLLHQAVVEGGARGRGGVGVNVRVRVALSPASCHQPSAWKRTIHSFITCPLHTKLALESFICWVFFGTISGLGDKQPLKYTRKGRMGRKDRTTEGDKSALTDRVMLGAVWFRMDPLALFGLRQMSKFSVPTSSCWFSP